MIKPKLQSIEVWGNLACFTRPELKVERFSYPIITPSSARGILDAIYPKPREFRWQLRKIEMLAPINYIALRRNEVKHVVSVSEVLKRKNETSQRCRLDGDRLPSTSDPKERTQRQTMALRNVHYRIHAEILPWPGFEMRQRIYEEQFRSRLEKGKCVYQPYFGCREFSAYFSPARNSTPPVDYTLDIGIMLYDVFDLARPQTSASEPAVSVFRAVILNGVLDVPLYSSENVLKAKQLL